MSELELFLLGEPARVSNNRRFLLTGRHRDCAYAYFLGSFSKVARGSCAEAVGILAKRRSWSPSVI